MRVKLLMNTVLATMVLFMSAHTVHAEAPEPLKVGQPAPDFKLPDQNGKFVPLLIFAAVAGAVFLRQG